MTEEHPLPGFFATWAMLAFKPRAFFSRPPAERSRWTPFKFTLAVYALSLPFNAVYLVLFEHGSIVAALLWGLAALALSPFAALVSTCIFSGLVHPLLFLVRSRHAPLKETFQCVCFSSAPQLFMVVPFVGGAIGFVWGIFVLSVALQRVQSTTAPRASFAAIGGLAIAYSLALAFRIFLFEPFKIPSGGMAPTVQVGDQIFANKFIFRFRAPRRGEVIVFRSPEDQTMDFIKRILAVGGDTIEFRDAFPYVNGSQVRRAYVETVSAEQLAGETGSPAGHGFTAEKYRETLDGQSYFIYLRPGSHASSCAYAQWGCRGPTRVPPGSVYVVGDNRDNSRDSRSFGFVPIHLIKGRANLIWASLNDRGDPRWSRMWTWLDEGG